MKTKVDQRAPARSVFLPASFLLVVLATVISTSVEAGSSYCPSCNLGTPQLSLSNLATPQFNQNISAILNASRTQFSPVPVASDFRVNWNGSSQLPNTFQPIELPEWVLPDWVIQLTPEWNNAAPGWVEALKTARSYRNEPVHHATSGNQIVGNLVMPTQRN